jgi:pimeloyl-ACP methyl ester carboxylesterase
VTVERLEVSAAVSVPWYPTPLRLAAWITIPERLTDPDLHLLIPGATYDHRYWDWPGASTRYSFVEAMAARGRATIAIDRLGTGASSRPDGARVDIGLHVRSLVQLMDVAESEGFGGHRFARFVLVGHSLGSIVAAATAVEGPARIRASVLTGVVAPSGAGGASAGVAAAFAPSDPGSPVTTPWIRAEDHPGLASKGLPPGYLTTRPGSRAEMFYRLARTDPDVVRRDEELQDTMTSGEVRSLVEVAESSRWPQCPTLVVVGQYDGVMYDALKDADISRRVDRRRSSNPDNVEIVIMPDTGHNLALHNNAPDTNETIAAWLSKH